MYRWCHLESAVGTEVVARANFYGAVKETLLQLPPKLVDVGESGEATPLVIPTDARTVTTCKGLKPLQPLSLSPLCAHKSAA